MNAYDFDDTIYQGDSGKEFLIYSLKYHPLLVSKHLFFSIIPIIRYIFKMVPFETVKESIYSYTKNIKNLEDFTNTFVEINIKKIKPWYKENRQSSDLIISASFDLWLEKFCKKLDIKNVICTKYNVKTGKIIGNNCSSNEKIKRLQKEYGNIEIDKSYSDSKKDIPLLEYAKEGYIVKGNDLTRYDKNKSFPKKKLDTFKSRDFLIFIFCGGMGTLTNFMLSLIISTYLHPILSYIIGYTISLFVAYFLNAKLIFNEKLKIKSFIRFVISYIPNFIILVSFVTVFINIFSINKVLVYILAALLGIPITYIFVKILAFNEKSSKIKKNGV